MDVIELTRERLDELKAFLAKDPVQNVYALGLLEEHGLGPGAGKVSALEFYGLLDREKLVGAVAVGGAGGLSIPCVFDPNAAQELGRQLHERLRIRAAFGERSAIDAFVRGLGCAAVRWSRPQRLFAASADDLGPFVTADLRLAGPADLPQLVPLSAAGVREGVGEDPLQINAQAFARRVEARVAAGRTYLLAEGKQILFKVDVGVKSRFGAEIEGLYTLPEARGRGLATRALGQLSRGLLSSIPRVVVRVDERDAALAVVCRKVGYTPMRPQRLVVLG